MVDIKLWLHGLTVLRTGVLVSQVYSLQFIVKQDLQQGWLS